MLAHPAFDDVGDGLHRGLDVNLAFGVAHRRDLLGELGAKAEAGQADDADAVNGTFDLAQEARQPFRYVDKGSMATIGRSRAVAEVRGLRVSGFVAWLLWLFVHIFYLMTFHNRIAVFLEWCWSYVTFRRGARLITGKKKLS